MCELILTQFCSSKDEVRIIGSNLRYSLSKSLIDQFYYKIINFNGTIMVCYYVLPMLTI